jgi:hypothetical protein
VRRAADRALAALARPTVLLSLLIVVGVLLYLLLGSAARTPFQLLCAVVFVIGALALLRNRLAGRVLPGLSLERFYLLAIGIDALLVANVKNVLPAGSIERWVWFIVAAAMALAYVAGFAIERRRLQPPS